MFSELTPVNIPVAGSPISAAFRQLSSRRSFNKGSPQPITFQEIQAYDILTAANLSPWEVETICSMDGVYINTWFDVRSGT